MKEILIYLRAKHEPIHEQLAILAAVAVFTLALMFVH
jgi:hypothetical protein